MRPGFFSSKPFIIAAVIGAVVLAGAGYAFTQSLDRTLDVESTGCAPAGIADATEPTPEDTGVVARSFGAERVITYTINVSAVNGTAFACSSYGDLEIRPSADANARVIFTIRSWTPGGAEAVRQTEVEARMRSTADRIDVLAWQATHVETRSFFDDDGASVDVTVELPSSARWKVDGDTSYGDVAVIRVPLAHGSKIDTSYGDVQIADVDVGGDFTVDTSYGDVEVTAQRVSTGRLSVDSSYGDLSVLLPGQPDAGYDVDASTSYGEAEVEIGETERYEKNKEEDTIRAKSAGFAAKTAQLTVTATTSYGDITIGLR